MAQQLDVKIDEKAKTMTIVMALQEPTLSNSGKTMVIATTSGNVPAGVKYKGQEVKLGVNAYFKPEK